MFVETTVTNRITNLLGQPGLLSVKPGTVLVASPAQQGTLFERSVVYVIQTNEQGTFGVVLNRPAADEMRTAWEQLTGAATSANFVQGGPIGGPVFALHQQPALAELAIGDGVFVSLTSDKFEALSRQPEQDYRIVFGLVSWPADQLVQQVESGYWFAMPGDAEIVFEDPEWLWEKSLRRFGRQVIANVAGVRQLPEDPLLN